MKTEKNLWHVLEGEDTLSDAKEVVSYAEACDMKISSADAERIISARTDWKENVENGGEWSLYRAQARAALA